MKCNQTFYRLYLRLWFGSIHYLISSGLFLLWPTSRFHVLMLMKRQLTKNTGMPPLPPHAGQSNPPFPHCTKAKHTPCYHSSTEPNGRHCGAAGIGMQSIGHLLSLSWISCLPTPLLRVSVSEYFKCLGQHKHVQQEGQWLYLHLQLV
jgi:hypothetical protein